MKLTYGLLLALLSSASLTYTMDKNLAQEEKTNPMALDLDQRILDQLSAAEDLKQLVTLKNGSQEVLSTVLVFKLLLDTLLKTNPVALYELAEKAHNPGYTYKHGSKKVLQEMKFVAPNGEMHSSLRNVVASTIPDPVVFLKSLSKSVSDLLCDEDVNHPILDNPIAE